MGRLIDYPSEEVRHRCYEGLCRLIGSACCVIPAFLYPNHRLVRVKPRLATKEELCRFHTPEYVDKIKRMSEVPIQKLEHFAL